MWIKGVAAEAFGYCIACCVLANETNRQLVRQHGFRPLPLGGMGQASWGGGVTMPVLAVL
jgi:hypothetical protein